MSPVIKGSRHDCKTNIGFIYSSKNIIHTININIAAPFFESNCNCMLFK